MKKLFFSVIALLCAMTSIAQPTPIDVEPGVKGPLPTVADVDKTVPANQFVGLQLNRVTLTGVIFNGNYYYETWLSFPIASDLGGEYYTLEFTVGDTWRTFSDSDGAVHFTYDNAIHSTPSGVTNYRLRMHGGDKDGFVSNVITVKPHTGGKPTHVSGWATSDDDMFILVGREQMKNFTFSVDAHDTSNGTMEEYTQDSEYMRFQWYRRNPFYVAFQIFVSFLFLFNVVYQLFTICLLLDEEKHIPWHTHGAAFHALHGASPLNTKTIADRR